MAAGGRRRSGLIFILLALVLIAIVAVVAFLLKDQLLPQVNPNTNRPVAAHETAAPPPTDVVDIIVLSQPVGKGSVITEGMLTRVAYPRSSMVEGLFFTDPAQVLKKQARYDLNQGVPLTPALLMDPVNGSYASTRIPRGMVAIAIPISRLTSNAYSLQAGDHVNILAAMLIVDIDPGFQTKLPNLSASIVAPGTGQNGSTTSTITISPAPGAVQGRAELDTTLNQAVYVLPSESQRPRLVSQTLVQDAVVLWPGTFPENGIITEGAVPTATPAPNAQGQEQAAQPAKKFGPDVISLIVTPQDAVTLNYLMLTTAKLNLVLRSAGDDQRISTEAVTLQFLLDQYNIPNPAKLPYGMNDPYRVNSNNAWDWPILPNDVVVNP
jgi:Flp pilus assembly protein CpaB